MKKNDFSIIVVEDHSLIAEGLDAILKGTPGISLQRVFFNAEEALVFLEANKIDVILLDISLPGMKGTEFCSIVKKQYVNTKIIALSNHMEKDVVQGMLANGADGYLLKNIARQELITSIFQIMNGQFVMQAELKKILFVADEEESNIPRLTTREKVILQLVGEGLTTGNIAARLVVSRQTVETHRKNLMQKFEVNNAAALVRKATELGLL